MLRDITLGQYFPGDTAVHRLDPRVKLALTMAYIAALFVARSWTAYAIVLASLCSVVAASAINVRTILRSLRPVVLMIAVTAVLNLFYVQGQPLVRVWKITVTREGVVFAVRMSLRYAMLIAGTFLLTYTTSPLALTDAIEAAFSPLKRVRFPAHELAMMMSIALRFIPTLIEETDKIMSAQKARGADFETGGLIKRAKAMLPVLVPLFVSAFRRSDELAEAMESRCYTGGEGRTRMRELRMRRTDWLAVLYGAAVVCAVVAVGGLP